MNSLQTAQIGDLEDNLAPFGEGVTKIKKEKTIQTVSNEVSYQESLYGVIGLCEGLTFSRCEAVMEKCKQQGYAQGSEECFEIRQEEYPYESD